MWKIVVLTFHFGACSMVQAIDEGYTARTLCNPVWTEQVV